MAAGDTRELQILIKLQDAVSAPLTGVYKQLDKLEPTLKKIAVTSGLAFGALTAEIGYATKSFANAGDALNDMATRTGFSVQSLSELKYAAELSGTSIEAIEIASRGMSDTMYQAAQGSDSAVAAFKSLGLSVGELRSMAPDEAFTKLASAVASVQDPFLRAAVAKDVFGKQGTQLLPLLADGASGLEKMRQEARDLGITMGGDAAKAGDRFNDSMTKLDRSITGVQFAIGSAFLPMINRVVDGIAPVITHIAKWIGDNPQLAAGITGAALAVTGLTFALTTLGLILPPLRVAIALFGITTAAALGPIGLAIAAIGFVGGVLLSSYNPAVDRATDSTAGLGKSAGGLADTFNVAGNALGGMADKAKEAAKQIADLEKRIADATKQGADEQQTYKENIAQALIDQEKKVADLRVEIQKKTGEKITDQNYQQHSTEMAQLQSQLQTEEYALMSHMGVTSGLQDEITEMRRRSNLTEFENRIETLERSRIAELQASKERMTDMVTELAALKAQKAQMQALEQGQTDFLRGQEATRLSIVSTTTAAINQSYASRAGGVSSPAVMNGGGGISNALLGAAGAVLNAPGSLANFFSTPAPSTPQQTTPPVFGVKMYAKGGVVTSPTLGIVGEAGPEAIIPLSKLGGMGGGLTVNVYGDLYGEEDLADKVSEALMNKIRSDSRNAP
jgi:hypothetical protein